MVHSWWETQEKLTLHAMAGFARQHKDCWGNISL